MFVLAVWCFGAFGYFFQKNNNTHPKKRTMTSWKCVFFVGTLEFLLDVVKFSMSRFRGERTVLDLKIRWLEKKQFQTQIPTKWWFNIADLRQKENKSPIRNKTGFIFFQTMRNFLRQIPQNYHRFASSSIPPKNGSHLVTTDKTQVSQLLPFLVTTPVVVSMPQQKHALVSSKKLAKLSIFNGILYP